MHFNEEKNVNVISTSFTIKTEILEIDIIQKP